MIWVFLGHSLQGIGILSSIVYWHYIHNSLHHHNCSLRCYYRHHNSYLQSIPWCILQPRLLLFVGKKLFHLRFHWNQGIIILITCISAVAISCLIYYFIEEYIINVMYVVDSLSTTTTTSTKTTTTTTTAVMATATPTTATTGPTNGGGTTYTDCHIELETVETWF